MAGPGLSNTNTTGTGTPAPDANKIANWLNKIDSGIQTPTAGKILVGNGSLWVVDDPVGGTPEGWFNVKDPAYGAVGGLGATNDTTAVQAALTACDAAGGGVVYFPPNNIYSCDDLEIPDSLIEIRGGGWSSIIKQRNSGDNHYLLSVNSGSGGTTSLSGNKTGIVVRDIQLLGTVAADGFLQHVHLLNVNACSDFLAFNVLFKGFRGDGAYIGSGNAGGIERHNSNIKFLSCTFDGVNQDNRNAISVIDCDGFWAAFCAFKNCTRTDMPGAIDFEPSSSGAYPVIRNVNVNYCLFEAIRGNNTGVITVWLQATQASLTTKSQGFNFTHNEFRNNTSNSLIFWRQPQQPANSDTENDLVIAHNIGIGNTGNRSFEIAGVRGASIHHNTWDAVPVAAALGYTYKVLDVAVDWNKFYGCGATSGRVIEIYRGTGVQFRYNDITDLVNSGVVLRYDVDGGATGASDNVHAIGNWTRNGGTSTAFTSKHASHTISGTNIARHNDLSGLVTTTINTAHFTPPEIYATTTYDPGSLANGVAATTTVTATGAATGDTVIVSHSSVDTAATAWVLTGYVSAADTVRVVILNVTGGTVDLASGTLRVRVFKQGFLN